MVIVSYNDQRTATTFFMLTLRLTGKLMSLGLRCVVSHCFPSYEVSRWVRRDRK